MSRRRYGYGRERRGYGRRRERRGPSVVKWIAEILLINAAARVIRRVVSGRRYRY